MRTATTLCLAVLMMSPLTVGQTCGPGDTYLSNDTLPVNPATAAVSIIPGLCENEAAGCVLDVSSIGATVQVNTVAVAYINMVSAGGIQAVADLSVFDGITWNGNTPTLGPEVFRYSTAAGANIGLTSSGINTLDISSFNVTVSSGQLVLGWWMLFNPLGGTCSGGYQTNFATDNSTPGVFCNPAVTPPHQNLIYILGQGWRDPASATVGGVPLCPFFYAGNWIIRACVTAVSGGNPLQITWTPDPVPTGGFATLTFLAPGHAGEFYLAAPAFSSSPGIPTPVGMIPLAWDPLLALYLSGDPIMSSIFVNWSGTISGGGTAPGIFFAPAGLAGPFSFSAAFVTIGPGGQLTGISAPATISIQ